MPREFDQAMDDYKTLFNTSYPIYLFERYTNYIDLFAYGGEADNPGIINFYLNNMDILFKFKYFFRDKAFKMIQQTHQEKFMLPEGMRPSFVTSKTFDELNMQKEHSLAQFAIRRYILSNNSTAVAITNRELEIMRCFTLGCTSKEAAKILNISPRTVEAHLNNIKLKLKINRKPDIIKLFIDLNIL